MEADTLRQLFDYSSWATARIFGMTEGLTPEQYVEPVPGVSHGSIHATLVHMLAADNIWRQRCFDGVSPTALLSTVDIPTFEDLKRRWAAEEAALRASIASLTDDQLNQAVDYRTTKGTPRTEILWRILVHVLNHGTQHRAEAAVGLTAFGRSPGDVDLIGFFRHQE